MKKRILILGLLLATTLCACGANQPSTANSSETASPSSRAVEPPILSSAPESQSSNESISESGDESSTEPSSEPSSAPSGSESRELPDSQAQEPYRMFQGERVTAVYSLDYAARTYQLVTGDVDLGAILLALETYIPEDINPGEDVIGFLVFTDKGKYPFYWPSRESEALSLTERANACNVNYPRHMQWFVFMSPENIERIEYGGFWYSIDTSDPAAIREIAAFLKSLPVSKADVKRAQADHVNPVTTADLKNLTITFNSGVIYRAFGNYGYWAVGSSDREEQLVYYYDKAADQALQDLVAVLPGAVYHPID